MEKIGHRYVIQYFYLKGLSSTNIKAEPDSTLGESAPSFTIVKYWIAEFKRGRTSYQDEHRSGSRPNYVTRLEKWEGEGVGFLGRAWDKILIEYLEKEKIINGEYCANLLQHLSKDIKQKLPHLPKKKVLFYQDNVPAYKSIIAMAKINELKLEFLPHSLYSPYLAPSDYYLFPNLKKWPSCQRLFNDEEVMSGVNDYFEEQDSSFYKKSIELIEHRWEKCRAERRLC
ncbi:mariner transposase [Trichonephila clavipes]|uniref:Mariner transposase n=1 Tax=Trichonephila clavipes TaxID=2585209 RepID=A0A8X6SKN8_TRICX|nr:mariner transposase [Trichonephila clavipes]